MARKKAEYAKPASQLDLEARLENDNRSPRILTTSENYVAPEGDEGRDMRVEGNKTDNYIGTDPMYQNYAEETHAPKAGSGVDDKVAKSFVENSNPNPEPSVKDEPEGDDEEEEEE